MEQKSNEVAENEDKEVSTEATEEFYGKSEGDNSTEVRSDDSGKGASSETESEEKTGEEKEAEKDQAENKEKESKEESKEVKGEKLEAKDLEFSKDNLLSEEEVQDLINKSETLGLNKEQTQALVQMQEESKRGFDNTVKTEFEKIQEGWLETVKKDPNMGGENFKRTTEFVNKFSETFVDDETRQWLKDSGMINHPGLMKAFARVGKEISEDKRIVGSPTSNAQQTPKSPEDIFYGS